MRIERENNENNLLIFCRNGGCSYAVYECFRRVNSFGADIKDSFDSIIVMSDYFDFDIILKIRDGYVYCEVHTNYDGNHSYTVIYSFEDLKRDIVVKLNELVFNTEKFTNLSLKEKRTICNCVSWYYDELGEKIPNIPYGITVTNANINFDIYSKTREDVIENGSYFKEVYKELLNITEWCMASENIAVSIMNWDSDIVGLYSVVDGKMLGIKPNSSRDILQCLCALIRLSIEVKTGYRTVEVEKDTIVIGDFNDNDDINGEVEDNTLLEIGYHPEKFEDFANLYKRIAVNMGVYDFKLSDFGIENTKFGMSVPRYLRLDCGEWV